MGLMDASEMTDLAEFYAYALIPADQKPQGAQRDHLAEDVSCCC